MTQLQTTSPQDDVRPWATPTRVVEELLGDLHWSKQHPTVRVYVLGTKKQMESRRRIMDALTRRYTNNQWGVSVARLDPHHPGGVNRISTWRIMLVRTMATT